MRRIWRELVFKNDFVLAYDDTVLFSSGNEGSYFHTEWTAPYGVAVLPHTSTDWILIRAKRYPNPNLHIEAPKGFGKMDSTPELCAKRELLEETGLTSQSWVYKGALGEPFTTHVFTCDVGEQFLNLPDSAKNEGIEEIIRVPKSKLTPQFVFENKISCPFVILAVSLLAAR